MVESQGGGPLQIWSTKICPTHLDSKTGMTLQGNYCRRPQIKDQLYLTLHLLYNRAKTAPPCRDTTAVSHHEGEIGRP